MHHTSKPSRGSGFLLGTLPLVIFTASATAADIGIVNGDFEIDADNTAPPTGWTDLSTATSFWVGFVGDTTGTPSTSAFTALNTAEGTAFSGNIMNTARLSAGAGSQPTTGTIVQTVDLSAFAIDIDGGEQHLFVDFDWGSNDFNDTGVFSLNFYSTTDGSGAALNSGFSVNLDKANNFAFVGDHESVGGAVPVGTRSVTLKIDISRAAGSQTDLVFDNFTGKIGGADSDFDGLPDIWEDQIINFDPNDAIDGYEDVAGPFEFPTTTDFDNDGRSDADEYANGIEAEQTDPTDPDSDNDGLNDGPEANGTDNSGAPHPYGATNPNDPDSDDDGLKDGPEVAGTDNDNTSHGFGATNPNSQFSDADSLPDVWEIQYGLNPNSIAGDDGDVGDPDLDSLDNAGEFTNGTNPTDPDSDNDGLFDGPEVLGTDNSFTFHGYGPTNPTDPDSDGDGFNDGSEILSGSSPNDSGSAPGTEVPLVNGGFENPSIASPTVGVPVSGGTVPGWYALVNDLYVIQDDTGRTMSSASEGLQFVTSDRRAPEPDLAPEDLVGGASATMSIFQDVDVSSFAGDIDGGARSLSLAFDWMDNDANDEGVVTVTFLDGSSSDLGRSAQYRTGGTSGGQWNNGFMIGYPPVGTRTVRLTAEVVSVGGGTARNVAFDNFQARLFHTDGDFDNLPDDWETTYGLNTQIDDSFVHSDADGLSNLQEFEYGTNPTLADTDGDNYNDDVEVSAGTDPNDANSTPIDSDSDGWEDDWELTTFGNLDQAPGTDYDADGCVNIAEQNAGTDLLNPSSFPDVNGDGLVDGFRLAAIDAVSTSSMDADGVSNWDGSLNPIAGYNYLVYGAPGSTQGSGLRTPTSGDITFAGDKLIMSNDGTNQASLVVKTTGVTTIPYFGMDGVIINQAAGGTPTLAGTEYHVTRQSEIWANNSPWRVTAPLTGSAQLDLTGGNTVTLAGANTFTGDINVTATGGLVLDEAGSLSFDIGASGVNNAIIGTGPVTLNGAINLDLTGASSNPGDEWDLITTTGALTIGSTFSVTGFTDDGGTVGSRIWTDGTYSYDEATGILSVGGANPDSDSDEMDDAWETTYFGGTGQSAEDDFDGDGTNNLTEFRLGLIPNDGSSRFAVSSTDNALGDGYSVSWQGAEGVTFVVQRSTDGMATWTDVSPQPGVAGAMSYTDPAPPAGKAFYRVQLLP